MKSHKPTTPRADEAADAGAPGTPAIPSDAGLVRGDERDVSDRPQGDPEVPELGAHDDERQPSARDLPD